MLSKYMYLLFCMLIPALLPIELARAEIYKWTDEKGGVHFSQIAPAPSNKNNELQKIQPSGTGLFSPRLVNGKWQCGSAAIPESKFNSQAKHVEFLQMFSESIQKELVRAEEYHLQDVRAKSSTTGLAVTSNIDWTTKIQEYKCLLGWAAQERDQYRDEKYTTEITTLKERYQVLSNYKEHNCPTPGSGMLIGPAANKWAECNDKVAGEMKSIEKRLEELEILTR